MAFENDFPILLSKIFLILHLFVTFDSLGGSKEPLWSNLSLLFRSEKCKELCKYSTPFFSKDEMSASENNGIKPVVVLDKNIDFAANVVSGARGQLLTRNRRKSNWITPTFVFSQEEQNPPPAMTKNGSLTPDPPRNPPVLLDLKLVKSDQDLSQLQNAESVIEDSVRLLSPEGAKSCPKEPKTLLSPLKWFKSFTVKKTKKQKNKNGADEKKILWKSSTFSIRKWLKGNHMKRKKGNKESPIEIEDVEEGKKRPKRRPSFYFLQQNNRASPKPANNLICVQQFQLSKVNFQTEFRRVFMLWNNY